MNSICETTYFWEMIAILGKDFISCLISSNNRNLQLLSCQKIYTLLWFLWNVWPWSSDYARLSFGVHWYLKFTKIGNSISWHSSTYKFHVAKCNLGEVKLERVGLRPSPIVVRDMWAGPLGNCMASLRVCSECFTALLLCLIIIADQWILYLLANHSRFSLAAFFFVVSLHVV